MLKAFTEYPETGHMLTFFSKSSMKVCLERVFFASLSGIFASLMSVSVSFSFSFFFSTLFIDPSVNIHELDIPVNAVATALKDFVSKRLPPIIPISAMDQLTDIALLEPSDRLVALRNLIQSLPPVNFEVIKFVFKHFVRISENSRVNSMDSKNLAICWWPTLLPLEFNDMLMFERMRPHLEQSIQTMIDQFSIFFEDETKELVV